MTVTVPWRSQAGQDEWVYSIVGDRGWFVDVGAYDGVEHSNTWTLERYFGWTGICVEPNVGAFERLRGSRQCSLSSWAISDRDGDIAFDGVHVGSGPLVSCRTLAYLLNVAAAPPVIDYLSIDVEGHELKALAGMDWERYEVRLLTVEHNLYLRGPDHKNAIAEFLEARGFKRVVENVIAEGYGEYEDWWQRVD